MIQTLLVTYHLVEVGDRYRRIGKDGQEMKDLLNSLLNWGKNAATVQMGKD
jgi:hypothetical protein